MIDYVIITDGSMIGNSCGCAGSIVNVATHRFFTFNEYLEHESHNYAEVYAVKKALEILRHECTNKKHVEILIVTDCISVVKYISDHSISPKAHRELYNIFDQMSKCKKYVIKAIHIPSHRNFDVVKAKFIKKGINLDDKTIKTMMMLHQRMDTEARAVINKEFMNSFINSGLTQQSKKKGKNKKSKKTPKGQAPQWMIDLFNSR